MATLNNHEFNFKTLVEEKKSLDEEIVVKQGISGEKWFFCGGVFNKKEFWDRKPAFNSMPLSFWEFQLELQLNC